MTLNYRVALVYTVALAFVCLSMASAGCSLFKPVSDAETATISGPEIPVAKYEVRIYDKDNPTKATATLDSNKTVQTVLEESGALDKFKKMEILLVRSIPGGEGIQKLEVEFDTASRNVIVSQDYAIHPGDIIVIRNDNSTALDHAIDKFTGALGLNG